MDYLLYGLGAVALALLLVRLTWRRRDDTLVSPVSEQWLAERRARRPPE